MQAVSRCYSRRGVLGTQVMLQAKSSECVQETVVGRAHAAEGVRRHRQSIYEGIYTAARRRGAVKPERRQALIYIQVQRRERNALGEYYAGEGTVLQTEPYARANIRRRAMLPRAR